MTLRERNICTQIGSEAKCWPDICHWGTSLAVTGRIRDIGQNVLQFSLQTWSSSNCRHFHFSYLIAFLEETFIWNIIIIPRVKYFIFTVNNKVINNNLWKTIKRPYFALQHSHGHAIGLLWNLYSLGTHPQKGYSALVQRKAISKTHSLNNLCSYRGSEVPHCEK